MPRKLQPLTPDLLRRVVDLLESQSTLTLAVTDDEGQPHAASVFYVCGTGEGAQQLELYWLSSSTSRHSVCVAQRQQAAVTIHQPTFHWQEIAGVQMRGLCTTIEGAEREAVLRRYRERFQLGALFGLAIRQSTLYRFHPTWLRLTDNRAGFGWKAECVLDSGATS